MNKLVNLTHEFYESGNGFPKDGDNVLEYAGHGEFYVLRVVKTSPIHTGNSMKGDPDMIYLTCEPDDDNNWNDMTCDQQDKAIKEMFEVSKLARQ